MTGSLIPEEFCKRMQLEWRANIQIDSSNSPLHGIGFEVDVPGAACLTRSNLLKKSPEQVILENFGNVKVILYGADDRILHDFAVPLSGLEKMSLAQMEGFLPGKAGRMVSAFICRDFLETGMTYATACTRYVSRLN
ncbi:hypothetical protein J4475_00265 [Candidatus Woesearchaeota archaeon]|nr:hypothetical protein [Candidatus Woesearchaeota archaeon]